jgi:uncharacterized membrane protein
MIRKGIPMKHILSLILTRFAEGFLVLLPFLLTYLMMGQLFDAMIALATPIADLLPKGVSESEWALKLEAAVLLVIMCLLVGMATRTTLAKRFGKWIEAKILNRIPPYVILRNLARRFSGRGVPNQLQPALVTTSPGIEILGFIVEAHTDAKCTVFLPFSPTPGVGTLQVVSDHLIRKLDVDMKDALGAILNWGAGTEALMQKSKKSTG